MGQTAPAGCRQENMSFTQNSVFLFGSPGGTEGLGALGGVNGDRGGRPSPGHGEGRRGVCSVLFRGAAGTCETAGDPPAAQVRVPHSVARRCSWLPPVHPRCRARLGHGPFEGAHVGGKAFLVLPWWCTGRGPP